MKLISMLAVYIIFSTVVLCEEYKVALVNVSSLDSISDMLLLKDENGKKLLSRSLTANKLYEEEKKKGGASENAYLSEYVVLNNSISAEKERMLYKYIRQVTDGKYLMVITDSGLVLSKDSKIMIIDVTSEVRDLINAQ